MISGPSYSTMMLPPLIFVNNNDSKAGKVFSLIHEYLHVLFEQEDIFLDPYLKTGSLETRINVLTAEVLMPREKNFYSLEGGYGCLCPDRIAKLHL